VERIHPKKALGQNFLVDGNVIANIIKAARIAADDRVLEIGPGRGALTSRLAEFAARVVAVEWDRELVPFLREKLAGRGTADVIHGDILRTDLNLLLTPLWGGRWKVVANLPYNISSQILFRFIEERALFSELLLMLQKEVGDRLVAPPSCKEYGILTVLCSLYFDIERVFLVKPASFRPVPKVDSVVLRFRVLPEPRLDVGDERLFKRVVKASFSQRRKTLWNCLKSAEVFPDDRDLQDAFEKAGIDGGRRGETLSLEEFARLTLSIKKCMK
jgi:16S rRNA (adenine1518-N6/adenine1519-N6)-dimethyltransferase